MKDEGDMVRIEKSALAQIINFAYQEGFKSVSQILNELVPTLGLDEKQFQKLVTLSLK